MLTALIISPSEKSAAFFAEALTAIGCEKPAIAWTCAEAAALLAKREFGVVIINASLAEAERGERLALQIAGNGASQVFLVMAAGLYEDRAAKIEDGGVIAVAKPVNKQLFYSALKIAKASLSKLRAMKDENEALTRKIEDMALISRAKLLLISYLNMSEPEAHKYIERQAMDMRVTRRQAAEGVLKTYEN